MADSSTRTESPSLSEKSHRRRKRNENGKAAGVSIVSKIFSPGLYLEGLLQLRAFTVISLILMFGNAVVMAVSDLMDYRQFLEYREAGETFEVYTYYGQYQCLSVLFVCFLVPVMTLVLFSFLNRRNCSDFYHSIPHTRVCLAVSWLLALVTNIVVVLGAGCLFGMVLYKAMPYTVEMDLHADLVLMFNLMCTAVFVMAIVWLAMTLTGSVFTNLTTAAMILIIPIFILLVTGYNIRELAPFIPASGLPAILTGAHNMISGFLSYLIFSNLDYTKVVSSASTGVWTLCEALLLIVIGCVIFRKRKSESAESAAIYPVVQSIFRIGAGFLISMLATQSVLNNLVNDYGFSDDEILGYAVIYLVALLVYYLYELISTKRARNLLHVWKGVLLLIALNIAWAGAEYGISTVMMNWSPDADQILSVEIASDDSYWSADWIWGSPEADYSYSEDGYWTSKVGGVKLTSEGARTVVAEALAHTIDLWAEYRADQSYYWMLEDSDVEWYYNMPVVMNFRIRTATGTSVRTVRMSNEQYEAFCQALAENETELTADYTAMPGYSQIDQWYLGGLLSGLALTEEQFENLYISYCGEIANADFKTFFYQTFVDDGYTELCFQLYIKGSGSGTTWVSFPITMDFTNTLNLLAEYGMEGIEDYVDEGKISSQNLLQAIADGDEALAESQVTLLIPDETEVYGYRCVWSNTPVYVWRDYLETAETASSLSYSGAEETEIETEIAVPDPEDDETEEWNTESGGGAIEEDTLARDYIRELWSAMADELEETLDASVTSGGEPILVICGQYWNSAGETYETLLTIAPVSERFVELMEEYAAIGE